jgi:hypothetical protein
MRRSLLALAALLLGLSPAALMVACGGSSTTPAPGEDAGSDASTVVDAGHEDAGHEDAGSDAAATDASTPDDAAAPDGGAPDDGGPTEAGPPDDAGVTVPLPGFGTITGSCGVLDGTELTDGTSYFVENHLDFGTDPYDAADLSRLTVGGQKIVTDPNAGGSSKLSEAFAVEVLTRCELASLLKTEMEIVYTDPAGKLTDELVQIQGYKIGVSVTRAVGYPFDAPYTVAQAKALLDKKLQGVLDSTANVSTADRWQKQILFVLAYAQEHADAIQAAYQQEPDALKSSTILYVTVTDGADAPIY